MRAILIATIAAVSLGGLVGCSPKVETQGDKTIVTNMGVKSTVVTGADAAAAAAALPAYAPVYPGAQVLSSMQTDVKGTAATAVTLTTSDSPEQVTAFYKAKMAGLGKVSEVNLGIGRMLVGSDAADGKGVQIMAMKASGRTQIQITQSTTPKG